MTHNYACKRLSQVTTNSNWKLKLAIDDFFFSFGRSLSATVAAAAALPATCSVACHDCNLDIGLWRVWKLTCALHFLWTLSAKLLTSPVQTTASQFQSTEPDGRKNAIFPWLHTTLQIHTAACAFAAAEHQTPQPEPKKILQGDYLDGFALEKISLRGVLNKQLGMGDET